MKATLAAEFRKLLTVRSTYVICLVFLLLSAFFAFYVHGYKDSIAQQNMLTGASPIDRAGAALFAASSITQVANIISVAGALVALLLLTHEYRYNTIVYTLTSANRRSKVLASKIIAVLACVLLFSVVATAISLALVWAGAAAAGHSLPPQNVDLLTYFGKCVFFCEAFAMAGLLFAALFRNQIGAIAALLIFPNTVEGLLALLLKKNAVYLPFTALQQVVQAPEVSIAHAPAHQMHDAATGSLTPAHGAWVFLAYLVAVWVIAWILFLRRDAN